MGELAQFRSVRDTLVAQLRELDRLRERHAAIELDSAIAILNERLGDQPTELEIEKLQRRLFLGEK